MFAIKQISKNYAAYLQTVSRVYNDQKENVMLGLKLIKLLMQWQIK